MTLKYKNYLVILPLVAASVSWLLLHDQKVEGSNIFNIAYIQNYLHPQAIEKVFIKCEIPMFYYSCH